MEIQQSPFYGRYIKALNWNVVTVSRVQIFLKYLPIIGTLAKIQRPTKLPPLQEVVAILNQHHVRSLALEPDRSVSQKELDQYARSLKKHFRLARTPFLPTKTIHIDLSAPEPGIFNRFSEAKRRAVRRALKNHVRISESSDIHVLVNIKNTSAGFLGFLTTYGIKKLWNIFNPKHAAILLAYDEVGSVVGGVLLVFWKRASYYWIAGATRKGKKLFAPTLLVWEALKLSKKRGCRVFDFVGVFDERRNEREQKDWRGFTKFKEGFGGIPHYYPFAAQKI